MTRTTLSDFLAYMSVDMRRLFYWAGLLLLAQLCLAVGDRSPPQLTGALLASLLMIVANLYLIAVIRQLRYPTRLFALLLILPSLELAQTIWQILQHR